jgi:hypothetical protein
MKRPRQLTLTYRIMIMGVPSSNKKQIVYSDEKHSNKQYNY